MNIWVTHAAIEWDEFPNISYNRQSTLHILSPRHDATFWPCKLADIDLRGEQKGRRWPSVFGFTLSRTTERNLTDLLESVIGMRCRYFEENLRALIWDSWSRYGLRPCSRVVEDFGHNARYLRTFPAPTHPLCNDTWKRQEWSVFVYRAVVWFKRW